MFPCSQTFHRPPCPLNSCPSSSQPARCCSAIQGQRAAAALGQADTAAAARCVPAGEPRAPVLLLARSPRLPAPHYGPDSPFPPTARCAAAGCSHPRPEPTPLPPALTSPAPRQRPRLSLLSLLNSNRSSLKWSGKHRFYVVRPLFETVPPNTTAFW